jgi:hypothetical protein
MQKAAGTEDTTTLYNGTRMATAEVKHAEQQTVKDSQTTRPSGNS